MHGKLLWKRSVTHLTLNQYMLFGTASTAVVDITAAPVSYQANTPNP